MKFNPIFDRQLPFGYLSVFVLRHEEITRININIWSLLYEAREIVNMEIAIVGSSSVLVANRVSVRHPLDSL